MGHKKGNSVQVREFRKIKLPKVNNVCRIMLHGSLWRCMIHYHKTWMCY